MVITGLEKLLSDIEGIRGRKIGLIANHTSLTSNFRYSWDMLTSKKIAIKRVFSPEHGLFGTEQDQVPAQGMRQFPFDVVSLYGSSSDSLAPDRSLVDDLDLVIFDIQDIGTRYYTYANTMAIFMKCLNRLDVEFMVLDRPNPLGGVSVEGPLIESGYESFVGILPVLVRHGLTAGELALLAHRHFNLDLSCTVCKMEGWGRDMRFEQTGLPWVQPSPNMPSLTTAALYPGMCLLEGTNVSEGRGTTAPFEVMGAPFIEPYSFARDLNGLDLPGVCFRPVYFKPTFNKYRDEVCGGVFMHITDPDTICPFSVGVSAIALMQRNYKGFRFLEGVYEFNSTHPAFDLLTGSSAIREMVLSGASNKEITGSWKGDENAFACDKEAFHIYRQGGHEDKSRSH